MCHVSVIMRASAYAPRRPRTYAGAHAHGCSRSRTMWMRVSLCIPEHVHVHVCTCTQPTHKRKHMHAYAHVHAYTCACGCTFACNLSNAQPHSTRIRRCLRACFCTRVRRAGILVCIRLHITYAEAYTFTFTCARGQAHARMSSRSACEHARATYRICTCASAALPYSHAP
jgi:hypothetical protein